jgi:hypothetical protein
MRIKVGPVSINTNNLNITLDRRTIKGAPVWKHAAYVAGGVIATAAAGAVVSNFRR